MPQTPQHAKPHQPRATPCPANDRRTWRVLVATLGRGAHCHGWRRGGAQPGVAVLLGRCAAARAAVLVASTWLGWCARSSPMHCTGWWQGGALPVLQLHSGGRAVRCLCCNSTPWPVGLAAARAAVLVASTWLGWCARSSRGVLRATYPARCAALAGGQAVRNLGLPGCLGGALLRVLLGLLHRPLADGP